MTPDHRPPARARAWAWNGSLAVLMVLTSLAVASVSAWLVFPYLVLMAVILITPPGRRRREEDHPGGSGTGPGPGAEGVADRAEAGADGGDADRASTEPAAEPGPGVEPAGAEAHDPGPRTVKARRGKGRGRKAKAVAESPGATATATWIRIGPGKFVRAEAPGPTFAPSFSPFEAGPAGPLAPSSGTAEGTTGLLLTPDRDDIAEAAPAAGASSAPGGGPEARAASAPDETAAVEPAPIHDEGDLGHGPGPIGAAGSAGAIDAVLEQPQGAPPYVSDPSDFFASLSGFGEGPMGAFPPGDRAEAEAVSTAEGSTAPGGGSEVEDETGPGEPVVDEAASTPPGGDPGHAWGVAFAAGSAGAVVPGSYPDAGGQELEEVGGVLVAGADFAAATGIEATTGIGPGPDGDEARDNGIAPDAFAEATRDNGIAPDALVEIPTAEIEVEDASPRDRVEDASAPVVPSGQSDRPMVGMFPAPWRGNRPRVGPATRWRPDPGATSPGRVVRSARRRRVAPALRRPLRRAPARSRPPCRTFPPRSPPALAGRS